MCVVMKWKNKEYRRGMMKKKNELVAARIKKYVRPVGEIIYDCSNRQQQKKNDNKQALINHPIFSFDKICESAAWRFFFRSISGTLSSVVAIETMHYYQKAALSSD